MPTCGKSWRECGRDPVEQAVHRSRGRAFASWLIERAREPSSWRGVAVVLVAFGVITVEQGAAVVGAVEILRRGG